MLVLLLTTGTRLWGGRGGGSAGPFKCHWPSGMLCVYSLGQHRTAVVLFRLSYGGYARRELQ